MFLSGAQNTPVVFHPLIMQFAAFHGDVNYGEYCTKYEKQVEAM